MLRQTKGDPKINRNETPRKRVGVNGWEKET